MSRPISVDFVDTIIAARRQNVAGERRRVDGQKLLDVVREQRGVVDADVDDQREVHRRLDGGDGLVFTRKLRRHRFAARPWSRPTSDVAVFDNVKITAVTCSRNDT